MTGWLPSPVEELFGAEATAEESYDVLTVDVPAASWTTALETARTTLTCTYFDWLSAVDEPGTGFRVAAHVVALSPVRRLLVRTTVAHDAPVLASAVDVYAGAAWHERETHEMFGVTFEGHPGLTPLLLPDTFEGHPLRKDFVLAARVAKAWPGAKEPGESEHGGPKRRQMLPPGVPDPNEWGPLKGQLPAAPARPARGAGRAAGAGAGAGAAGRAGAGERPPRRTRSVSQGSASQTAPETQPTGTPETPETPVIPETPVTPETPEVPATPDTQPGTVPTEAQQPDAPARPPRRARSASQGSASQRAATPEPEAPEPATSEPETPEPATTQQEPPAPKAAPEPKSDAPWHHARPAFEPSDQPKPTTKPDTPRTGETENPKDTADTGKSADTADTADSGDTGNTGGTE
ncbi:NADH-quinone oxidoreductase subunit C [Streptomyces sp. NPDC020607]|uniref:NADH-quinone oxidoreductase subunit C n=1 Tax=Streptomyces sp. NPDC020607 TaxID=3365082 RepID=UPI00379EF3A9